MGDERTRRPAPEADTRQQRRDGRSDARLDDLILLASGAEGMRLLPLPSTGLMVLGRVTPADVILDDDSVSRQHARVAVARGLTLEDLGSRNGTRLQGRELKANDPVSLPLGASFELGNVTCVIQRARDVLGVPTDAGTDVSVSTPGMPPFPETVLVDPSMKRIYGLLDAIGPSNMRVLVLGETGVGKEVFAEAVHRRSKRADKAFLQLNCAALHETLLEAELFGYERGAFTGAQQAKQGLFESADGGTVFLDEIGELALSTQAKLLRFLESGELLRVGSVKPRKVDVRIVSATNRDLRQLIATGAFRADLFFRINGISITLPPLRKRTTEIVHLARLFAKRAADQAGRAAPTFDEGAVVALERHAWPGNIRELRNVVERAVVMCSASVLRTSDLLFEEDCAEPPSEEATSVTGRHSRPGATDATLPTLRASRTDADGPLRAELERVERTHIEEALAKAAGNQTKAARMLGMSRFALLRRLEALGVDRPRKARE